MKRADGGLGRTASSRTCSSARILSHFQLLPCSDTSSHASKRSGSSVASAGRRPQLRPLGQQPAEPQAARHTREGGSSATKQRTACSAVPRPTGPGRTAAAVGINPMGRQQSASSGHPSRGEGTGGGRSGGEPSRLLLPALAAPAARIGSPGIGEGRAGRQVAARQLAARALLRPRARLKIQLHALAAAALAPPQPRLVPRHAPSELCGWGSWWLAAGGCALGHARRPDARPHAARTRPSPRRPIGPNLPPAPHNANPSLAAACNSTDAACLAPPPPCRRLMPWTSGGRRARAAWPPPLRPPTRRCPTFTPSCAPRAYWRRATCGCCPACALSPTA